MRFVSSLLAAAVWWGSHRTLAAEKTYDDGYAPKPPEPFPAKFRKYQILPGTFSPDREFALIYPKRSEVFTMEGGLYLAHLKPFRIVAEIPLGEHSLTRVGKEGYAVSWARDESALLVEEDWKWGPGEMYLVTLRRGKVKSVRDILKEVEKPLHTAFVKSKAEPYNDAIEFVFDADVANGWELGGDGRIRIEVVVSSAPNQVEGDPWAERFIGVWDIAERRLIQQKVRRAHLNQ